MLKHGTLPIALLNLVELNDTLRRIQESLDEIGGFRGSFVRGRWTFANDSITYKDSNGQLLHGIGTV